MADKSDLRWSIPANLRWLADNPDASRLPCGYLHGQVLHAAADMIERRFENPTLSPEVEAAIQRCADELEANGPCAIDAVVRAADLRLLIETVRS